VKDILYVLGSIAFFALMIAYVAGCDRIGRAAEHGSSTEESRS